MTTIVNVKKAHLNKRGIKDFPEWKSKDRSLYVGRNMSFYVDGATGSKWQNPYPLKKYTLDESLNLYEKHIRSNEELFNSLHELKDKELGCWCKPNRCHGDILIKLLKERFP